MRDGATIDFWSALSQNGTHKASSSFRRPKAARRIFALTGLFYAADMPILDEKGGGPSKRLLGKDRSSLIFPG